MNNTNNRKDTGRPGKSKAAKDSSSQRAKQKPWLPDPESVIGEGEIRSPSGKTYRVIKTNLTDAD